MENSNASEMIGYKLVRWVVFIDKYKEKGDTYIYNTTLNY